MAFTRRADLTCTYDEMMQYGSVVLLKNEIIRIKMNDGTFSTKRGDGVTPLSQLPFEIDHELSNILKVKKSGVGMVSFGNISPLNHMISVKVDVDNVADYRDVTVTRRGKNMFNNDTSVLKAITYRTNDGRDVEKFGYALALPAGVYTASLIDLDSNYGNRYIYGTINDKNGAFKQSGLNLLVNGSIATRTFTIDDGDIYYIYDGVYSAIEASMERFNTVQIQVEPGREATSFAPYVEPVVYFVTQEGRTSIPPVYPVTTLSTDSRLRIEALYNVNIHDLNEEVKTAKNDIQSAKKNIATLQGKVSDLTYTIDVMEGNELESVGETVTMIDNDFNGWKTPLKYSFSEELIDAGVLGVFGKLCGGGLDTDIIVDGVTVYVKEFILKPTKIELLTSEETIVSSVDLSEVVEKLNDYGVYSSNTLGNYIMFGDRGVYYVQNATIDREKASTYKVPTNLSFFIYPLEKPIVTDITEYFNDFSPYFTVDEVNTIRVHADAEDVLPLVYGDAQGGTAIAKVYVEILLEEA